MKVRIIIFVLAIIAVFSFFQFCYPYHFFYQEQNQIFLWEWEYISGYFAGYLRNRPAAAKLQGGDIYVFRLSNYAFISSNFALMYS